LTGIFIFVGGYPPPLLFSFLAYLFHAKRKTLSLITAII